MRQLNFKSVDKTSMVSKIVGIALLSSVVLVGCGSSSDSKDSAFEYSLSEYEGRVVNTDTLAGVWVSVGTGYTDIKHSEGIAKVNFAVKEYFVITESDSGYKKSSCQSSFNQDISINDNVVTFNNFVGKVTDNKWMTGNIVEDTDIIEDEYSEHSETNLRIMKISDELKFTSKVTTDVDGKITETNSNCYKHSNQVSKSKKSNIKSETIIMPTLIIGRWSGDEEGVYILNGIPYFYLNTGVSEGDSVSFEINSNSNLTEMINFTATDGVIGVTGRVDVQLPAQ